MSGLAGGRHACVDAFKKGNESTNAIIDDRSTRLVRAFAPRPADDELKPKLTSGAGAFEAGQLERSSDAIRKGTVTPMVLQA
jgi:hypothetical protein